MVFRRRARRAARRPARRAPRRYVRRARKMAKGHVVIKRKAELCFIRNTGIAGAPTTTGVVNSMVFLGTPEASTVYTGNYYNVPFTCQFSLGQVIASTELTNLADRYKIKSVNLKWRYNTSQENAAVGTTINSAQPLINYVIDHDDASVQTVSSLRQKMGLKGKVFNPNRQVSMSVAPRPNFLLGDGAGTAAQIPSKAAFVDCNSPNVPHFGIKGYIEGLCLESNVNLNSVITIDATFTIELKDFQ